jgi:hypothetical protein
MTDSDSESEHAVVTTAVSATTPTPTTAVAPTTGSESGDQAAGVSHRQKANVKLKDLPQELLKQRETFNEADMSNVLTIERATVRLVKSLDIYWIFVKPSERVLVWPTTDYDWAPTGVGLQRPMRTHSMHDRPRLCSPSLVAITPTRPTLSEACL